MANYVSQVANHIRNEVHKVIVGQDAIIDQILICLLAEGHALLEGVPGTAKTLMVKTLARILGVGFNRIQFTPDLMPSDITGTNVFNVSTSQFSLRHGPVFTDILLGDEINRTPPKTQAALLEAMEERQVTIDGESHLLSPLFLVLATENPIEYEGTYPLPEAQLDRFMFNVWMGYLPEEDEVAVVKLTTSPQDVKFERMMSAEEIIAFQRLVRKVPVADSVTRYAVNLVHTSRPGTPKAPDFVNRWVTWGGSIRASQFLVLAAKARAIFNGRYNVSFDDIRAVAQPVLRHRILLNFQAESERVDTIQVIKKLIEVVPEPKSGL